MARIEIDRYMEADALIYESICLQWHSATLGMNDNAQLELN